MAIILSPRDVAKLTPHFSQPATTHLHSPLIFRAVVSVGKSQPPESSPLAEVALTPEKACNSLFIRYNHAHGNHAAAKRGHRLSFRLHPEERLLPFLRGDRQRAGPQLPRH